MTLMTNYQKMKNILFPTDFSEAANNAFVYALKLAEQFDAQITTLHVYELPKVRGTAMPNTIQEIYESINIEEFDNYRDSIPVLREIAEANNLDQVQIQHSLKEGPTVKTILHSAKEVEADLIVMGTTGAGALKAVFIGSVAGEILENANIPVLAVPQTAKYDGKIDQIAITTEFTDEERKALDRTLEFAAGFGAQVHLVNVDTAHTHFYTKRMEKLKADYANEKSLTCHVLNGTELFAPLNAFLNENRVDILAMLTHKRTFFQELFNFSHAKSMSYQSNTPILSIQAHTL